MLTEDVAVAASPKKAATPGKAAEKLFGKLANTPGKNQTPSKKEGKTPGKGDKSPGKQGKKTPGKAGKVELGGGDATPRPVVNGDRAKTPTAQQVCMLHEHLLC